MNSSFIAWGQFLLGLISLGQTVLLIVQYGVPRDTIRVLGVLLSVLLSLFFMVAGVSLFGYFPIFHFPTIYGILAGAMAFCLPAFTYLGVVDCPGQLQRKVMWRFPIVGALLGHWLNTDFMLLVMLAGWLVSAAIVVSVARFQRYTLRIIVTQLVLGVVYYVVLNQGYWWIAQVLCVFWILSVHRFISTFLVKNLAREFVSQKPEGVQA